MWEKREMLCIYQELDSNTTLLRKTALRELTGESKQLERNNYPFLMGGKKNGKRQGLTLL